MLQMTGAGMYVWTEWENETYTQIPQNSGY